METLELLGIALGLATLAGINLYLTVLVTGLAVRFEWIHLASNYQQLEILADPAVLWISGVLFLLEFFADKVPWVDSLWDSVHTLIRPVGAALLAITVHGDPNPVFDVIVGLLAGGMALTTHAAKSGTRLIANASPEPISNIALSVGEDVLVVGGLALIAANPVLALVIALVVSGIIIWLLPKLFRRARATLWLIWRRIGCWFGASDADSEPAPIPSVVDQQLAAARGLDARVIWYAPCLASRIPGVPSCTAGWMLVTAGDGAIYEFAWERGGKVSLHPLGRTGAVLAHHPGFLCERLDIYHREQPGDVARVCFDRSRRVRVSGLLRMMGQDRRSLPEAGAAAAV